MTTGATDSSQEPRPSSNVKPSRTEPSRIALLSSTQSPKIRRCYWRRRTQRVHGNNSKAAGQKKIYGPGRIVGQTWCFSTRRSCTTTARATRKGFRANGLIVRTRLLQLETKPATDDTESKTVVHFHDNFEKGFTFTLCNYNRDRQSS